MEYTRAWRQSVALTTNRYKEGAASYLEVVVVQQHHPIEVHREPGDRLVDVAPGAGVV